MKLLVTHLIAAITPILIFFITIQWKRKRQQRHIRQAFWSRQRPEGLRYLQKLPGKGIPAPLNIIGEIESWQTLLYTVAVITELGALEFMANQGPVSTEELARFLKMDERTVKAALEVFLAGDIVSKTNNRYQLTPRAHMYLHPNSAFFEFLPGAVPVRRFIRVLKSRKMQRTIQRWQKGKAHHAEQWLIQQTKYSFPLGFALSQKNIFEGRLKVLDVAGGSGAVCIALASEHPELELQLIELPQTIPIAKKMISRYNMSHRIQCLGMDMFRGEWPSGMDRVIFSNIFHDWNDEHCQQLARKAFHALKPGGKIVLIEALLQEDPPGPLWTAHWTMTMALMMEGRQFHKSELIALLEDSGFTEVEVQDLLGYYSVITATRPAG